MSSAIDLLNYAPMIADASKKHNIRPALITSMIAQESAFNPAARSPKGAMGLMQLMPGTAQEMGVTDPLDPVQNIHGGARYLRKMLDMFEGDEERALAAYNAGPGRVRAGGSLPLETQKYVPAIMGRAKGGATQNAAQDPIALPNRVQPTPNALIGPELFHNVPRVVAAPDNATPKASMDDPIALLNSASGAKQQMDDPIALFNSLGPKPQTQDDAIALLNSSYARPNNPQEQDPIALFNSVGPKPAEEKDTLSKVLDWFPTVGGVAGGVIAAIPGVVAAEGGGTIPIAGAALGGAAGEAVRQGVEHLRGHDAGSSVWNIPAEGAKQGVYEVGGRLISAAVRAPLAGVYRGVMASKPAVAAAAELNKRFGLGLTAPEIAGGTIGKAIQHAADHTTLGGAVADREAQQTAAKLPKAAQAVGQQVQSAIASEARGAFQANARQLYELVERTMGKHPIDFTPLAQFASELERQGVNVPALRALPAVVDFKTAQALKSAIMSQLGDPLFRGTTAGAKAQAGKLIDTAIAEAAHRAGNGAAEAWHAAKAFYAEGARTLNNPAMQRVTRAVPERIGVMTSAANPTTADAVTSALSYGRSLPGANPATFDAARAQLDALQRLQEIAQRPGSAIPGFLRHALPYELAAGILHPGSVLGLIGAEGAGGAVSKLLRTERATDFLLNGLGVNAPRRVVDPLMAAILRAGSQGNEQ
jgi:hypothetical protein